MKLKHSWIPFIPITLAMIALNVVYALNSANEGFSLLGINASQFTYVNIFLSLVIFVLSLVICLSDKYASNFYKINKNFCAGIFAILFALALAFDGANKVLTAYSTANWQAMSIIDMIVSVFAAIVFIVVGLTHITGNGKSSFLYIVPAIWCCLRLFATYLDNRTVSVSLIDVTYVVFLVMATMFLFYQGEIIALINNKIALKSSVIFGLSAAALSFSYTAKKVIEFTNTFNSSALENVDVYSYLPVLEVFLLGVYMVFFSAEITSKVLDKSQVKVIDDSKNNDGEIKREAVDEDSEDLTESSDAVQGAAEDIPGLSAETDEVYAKDERIPRTGLDPEAKKKYAENKRQGKTKRYLTGEDDAENRITKNAENNTEKKHDEQPHKSEVSVGKIKFGKNKGVVRESVSPDDDYLMLSHEDEIEFAAKQDDAVLAQTDADGKPQGDFAGVEDYIYKQDKSYYEVPEDKDSNAQEYYKRLDDIDKLILQLSEDEFE